MCGGYFDRLGTFCKQDSLALSRSLRLKQYYGSCAMLSPGAYGAIMYYEFEDRHYTCGYLRCQAHHDYLLFALLGAFVRTTVASVDQ
jgi:hypothetical protein